MIVRKSSHREITMIIPVLKPDVHFPFLPFFGRFDKVLGQELGLFVEIVVCALLRFIPVGISEMSSQPCIPTDCFKKRMGRLRLAVP